MDKQDLKSLKRIAREQRLASGVKLTTRVMLSKRDKARDPKRQRQNRSWLAFA